MNHSLLAPVEALLLKRGVGLGGLPLAEQALVFALVWAGLPDVGMTERQVNEQLKSQLQGAASFLDTDHVELRRWMVDAGWLRRDGYGREYCRTPLSALDVSVAAGQGEARALAAMPVATWAADQRAAHETRRQARRQAWDQQQARQQVSKP